jgi:hypothetical protein
MELEININKMSKTELQHLLITIQKEIQEIDSQSYYSFSYYYYYYKDGNRRNKLAKQVDEIKLQIMYKEDDEHFAKYKSMKDKDPLKMFPKFYLKHK